MIDDKEIMSTEESVELMGEAIEQFQDLLKGYQNQVDKYQGTETPSQRFVVGVVGQQLVLVHQVLIVL